MLANLAFKQFMAANDDASRPFAMFTMNLPPIFVLFILSSSERESL